ncbi:MAG: hypothetical protein ABFC42_10190 [Sulfuricella sp.]
MMWFHWSFSNDNLALIAVLSIVIVFLIIGLAITADWLIEIFRSQNHDR